MEEFSSVCQDGGNPSKSSYLQPLWGLAYKLYRMLRIGKVKYLNTLPLFYELRGFDIVEGHPSKLVKLLREGKIDGGIVSSVEYFFSPESYEIIPNVSISSRGKVCSVLLLSNRPLRGIRRIRVTPNSLTSKYLLAYVLKEGYGLYFEEVEKGEDALLVIGDEAIDMRGSFPYVYDLGEEWFRLTELPFVFALFLVRRGINPQYVLELERSLRISVERFYEDLRSRRLGFSDGFLVRYFSECIDYTLGEDHIKALERFFSFMERETGMPAPKGLRFACG